MSKNIVFDESFIKKAKRIKLLLMDCDGVLTDGNLYYTNAGEEMKVFNVRDGQGLVTWHKAGFISGIITGRGSEIVKKRACELGIDHIKLNIGNKAETLSSLLKELNISEDETAYIGDDTPDIEALKLIGMSFCVEDAEQDVIETVLYKTKARGGRGAVREIINALMKAKKT